MKIHALSVIRIHNHSDQAAADLNLRPHGHRDRIPFCLTTPHVQAYALLIVEDGSVARLREMN
jgi:hypothetical protein